MLRDPLWRAWAALAVLSLLSTALTQLQDDAWLRAAAGTAILVLGYVKARLILGRYLGLAAAPYWYRSFTLVIALYMAGLLALYLASMV